MTESEANEYAREAAQSARAAVATQLNRIYAAVDYFSSGELEGQDDGLTIEMSQAMLDDVIQGHGLRPMVEYVKRYCDVIDGPEDAERIAADI
jgi:hypothetical protein